jgi:putative membrane protein
MWLDAILAYLHFTAIFLLFAFLTVQIILIRQPLDMRTVRLLGRMDIWYFSSAIAALVTGFLRATLGAKGADFYFNAWPIYAKIALFLAVGLISVKPTMTFIRPSTACTAARTSSLCSSALWVAASPVVPQTTRAAVPFSY